MALTVTPDATLERPSLILLARFYLQNSFPLILTTPAAGEYGYGAEGYGQLPYAYADPGGGIAALDADLLADFDAEPLRWSTRDVAGPDGQYEGRLVHKPEFLADQGLGAADDLTLSVIMEARDLSRWWDPRLWLSGKVIELDLFDVETGEYTPRVWSGTLATFGTGASPHVYDLLCTPDEPGRSSSFIPARLVGTSVFPQAPINAPATGGAGSALPTGIGRGRNLPARLLRVPIDTEDDPLWLASPCVGTAAIHTVRLGGATLTVDQDYTIQHRGVTHMGRPLTAIRLVRGPFAGVTVASLTADVERRFRDVRPATVSLYTWAAGLHDWVGRHHAVALAPLTSANRITGRSGFGLGAVRMLGDGGGLEFPNPAGWSHQQFTLHVEARVPSYAVADQTLLTGPGAAWTLEYHADALEWHVAGETLVAPLARNTWASVALKAELDGTDLVLSLYVDGVAIVTETVVNGVITYGAARAFTGGEWDIGALEFLREPETAGQIQRSHATLLRSPVELLREVAEETGDFVDEAAYWAAVQALPAGLHADGWVTEPVKATVVYQALGIFRELRPLWDARGIILPDVYQPATTITASLDVGAGRFNAARVSRRQRSTAESVSVQPICYRQQRGPDGRIVGGPFGEYQHERTANLGAAGGIGNKLACPFIDDHGAADHVRDWLEKLVPLERDRLDIHGGHETRGLARGDLVQVTSEPDRLANAPYRVRQLRHLVSHSIAAAYPYDAFPFSYSPHGDLPEDAVAMEVATLPIGDEQRLVLTAPESGDLGVGIDVWLLALARAVPTVALLAPGGGPLDVGAATPRIVTAFIPVAVPLDPIRPVMVVRVSLTVERVGTALPLVTPVLRAPNVAGILTNHFGPNYAVTDTQTITEEWTTNPATGDPWDRESARSAQWGVSVIGFGTVRVLATEKIIGQLIDVPESLGALRVWRMPLGSGAARPFPSETTPPTKTYGTLRGNTDTVAGPGLYQYAARVYDRWLRMVLALPPAGSVATVEVPA